MPDQAFRFGDATVVVPLDFLRIPLIALVGWMFYGETLDVLVFAGAGLIMCGVLWNLRAESRRTRAMPATATEKAQSAESVTIAAAGVQTLDTIGTSKSRPAARRVGATT